MAETAAKHKREKFREIIRLLECHILAAITITTNTIVDEERESSHVDITNKFSIGANFRDNNNRTAILYVISIDEIKRV